MPFTYSPPGFLNDLSAPAKAAWHKWISDQMDAARAGRPADNDGPRSQFFNQAKKPPDSDAQTQEISWTAFPRQVQISTVGDPARWRKADSTRNVQDEYCEWSVTRDAASNKVLRVELTCEGPEYWTFLAQADPNKTLALYREHIDPAVNMADLFPLGRYDPQNRWNANTVDGAMHLIQRSNSLGAEIELAGGASTVRLNPDGSPKMGAAELIACGQYGAPDRHSDPHIGEQVNNLTRTLKCDITLADPVGLYFDSIDLDSWTCPDDSDPAALVRYTRGSAGHWLRMVVAAPDEAGFKLGDVAIGGRKIDWGGQIADCIRIKLIGLATRIGKTKGNPVKGCVGDSGAFAALAGAQEHDVEAALAAGEGRKGRR